MNLAAAQSADAPTAAPFCAPDSLELISKRSGPRWWQRLLRPWRTDAARQEYVETVKRLGRAVHGSTDGLWEWDFATGRVWIMPNLAALLGQTVADLPTHIEQWWDEIHPEDVAGVQTALYRHRDFGEPYERQFRFRVAGGGYRWFRARGLAYRDPDGKALVMAGSICDVDELFRTQQSLREVECQLLQQQKVDAIGSLAGGLAHEFNNLLQAIRGYASFAQEAAVSDQQEADLRQVLETCDRAAAFTRQLLDFGRKATSEPAAFECDALLGGLQALLKPLLPPGVQLIVQQQAGAATVHGSERLMQQALLNLCINACDAMPDGGRLLVRSERCLLAGRSADVGGSTTHEYVRILVTDTGVGVSPAVAPKLFQPFFTTKPPGQGTGLGLSTAQSIVARCGGWMDHFSELGHGATFRIYLPLSGEVAPTPETVSPVNPGPLDATVLLAEDDPAAADVSRRMLEHAGAKVIVAQTGDEAIQVFRERIFEIDAVVLDLAMPGLSGRTVLEQIRDMAPQAPACVSTGYDPAAPQFDRLRAMGCQIIEKPFDERGLLTAVHTAMSMAADPLAAMY